MLCKLYTDVTFVCTRVIRDSRISYQLIDYLWIPHAILTIEMLKCLIRGLSWSVFVLGFGFLFWVLFSSCQLSTSSAVFSSPSVLPRPLLPYLSCFSSPLQPHSRMQWHIIHCSYYTYFQWPLCVFPPGNEFFCHTSFCFGKIKFYPIPSVPCVYIRFSSSSAWHWDNFTSIKKQLVEEWWYRG